MRTWTRSLARRLPVVRQSSHASELSAELSALKKSVRELDEEVRSLHKEFHRAHKELNGRFRRVRADFGRQTEILRFVLDDEPGNRRRLWEARASPEYELAYSEAEPLVTVIIPTYANVETLVSVAVPSLLAQTHRNLEILVVGDGEPPGTAEALARVGDPRIVYFNRERRGPYPDDPKLFSYVKAGPPFNEGLRRARGRWLAVLADDDAFRPDAIEALVAAAQEHRYEYCYGQYVRGNTEQGEEASFQTWPPSRRTGMGASVWHVGLRFLEFDHAARVLGRGWDKTLIRRMLHIGVRFGMVEKVIMDFDPVHEGLGGHLRARNQPGIDEGAAT